MENKNSLVDVQNFYEGSHSILVLVIGKSGRGKSTAIRNLPPENTYIINVMGKPLPFIGAAKKFREDQNMRSSAEPSTIRQVMQKVSRDMTDIHHLVIDDAQYIMATEFMQKAMVKGYDKFTQMAKNMWDILVMGSKLRAGLKVYLLCHEQDDGNERKMKTLGKLLDEKLTPEGLSTIVLYSDVAGEKGNRQYFFSTQSDGYTNAKSPMGMFPPVIPNDLNLVGSRIDEYYQGIELKDSKIRKDLESVKI